MSIMNARARAHRFEFEIPVVYDREPDDVAKLLWKAARVPPENYQRWTCPCCDQVKVIYAPDDRGHVWIILTSSTRTDGRDVIRLDNAAEVAELVDCFPCASDRFLLAAWYAAGLDDILSGLFSS